MSLSRMRTFWLMSVAVFVLFTESTFADTVLEVESLQPRFTDRATLLAIELYQRGDFSKARDALLKQGNTEKNQDLRRRRRFLLAQTCIKANDLVGAVSVLDGLADELPLLSDRVRFMLGSTEAELGRDESAVATLSSIDPSFADYDQVQSILADLHLKKGNIVKALELLDLHVRNGHQDPASIGRLAGAMLANGRKDEAIAAVRKAYFRSLSSGRKGFRTFLSSLGVDVKPSLAERLTEITVILDAHRNQEAVDEARRLASTAPADIACSARFIEARGLAKLRKHSEALKAYDFVIDRCVKHVDMPRVLFLANRSAYRAEQNDLGDRFAERLAKDHPDASFNDDIALTRARMAIGRNEPVKATAILEESLRRWPNGDMAIESRWLIAWAAIRDRQWDLALTHLRKGLAIENTSTDSSSRFAYWEGRVLQFSKKTAQARLAYEKCVREFPLRFYGVLALNRLAQIDKTTPQNAISSIKGLNRGLRFLTVKSSADLDQGPLARSIYLAQTGLLDLAIDEVSSGSDGGDTAWVSAFLLDSRAQHSRSFRIAKRQLDIQVFWPSSESAGYYELAYPRPYANEVARAAKESSIDPLLIWAVMREESTFKAQVESWANAVGLMQLIIPTAKAMGKRLKIKADRQSLTDPSINIRLGAGYLRILLDRFKNPLLAIPGYNAGGGSISRWLKGNPGVELDSFVESISAEETRNYARKVFESYSAYRLLYGDEGQRYVKVNFKR